jgi:NagD protein
VEKTNYLIDMDGVLVRGQHLIPGADQFIERLRSKNLKFLVLTNNPIYTQLDLAHRLQRIGLEINKEEIFTSAMATAHFLQMQNPNCKAFVIGESGLQVALHEAGIIQTEFDPEYVVLGETNTYNFEQITKAVRLIAAGARFIATNPDPTGPTERGILPACGAMAALIERATGRAAFFIGKPNPFMMRAALNYLGIHSESTVMVGDRMDTDIVAGIQSGLGTVLVLSGLTSSEEIESFPYRPQRVINSVAELEI